MTLAYGRDVEDLLFERVFTPIGIGRDDLQWRNNQYRPHRIKDIPRREFGSGVNANVDALARIGYLYLHEGIWQDREILTKQFVRTATRPLESVAGLPEWDGSHGNASDHYGLLWWNNADRPLERIPPDAFWAWGLYDSLIVVIPSLDLVAVRGGARGKSWPRNEGENHYDVLAPFLEPIVEAAVSARKEESKYRAAQLILRENLRRVFNEGACVWSAVACTAFCFLVGLRLSAVVGNPESKEIQSGTGLPHSKGFQIQRRIVLSASRPFQSDGSRKQDIILLVDVLMHVGFEVAESVEHRAVSVAGVAGNCEVAGCLADLRQCIAGIVVLVFHHANGIGDGAKWE